ncbi:MAG: NAD(P)/FAD-dependent oxidoreductase [Flavobacteriales bacterium]|nr:NAD(P)/FAD-dependent oxidoreductase [Flavobacteriales bacterium]
MEHYDLCVIGGGPAGYAAAMRGIDLGQRVLLVERDRIGGTGIYNGALTSKTMWEIAQRASNANALMRTRGREPFRLDWSEVMKAVNEAAFERKYLYACHMQLLASHTRGGLFQHERGEAHFLDPNVVRIQRPNHILDVRASHVIIATGSRPRHLPGIETDERRILTSDGIFNLEEYPQSIVIVGAGVIGCEFATIFSLLGNTRVHLIDRAERILPFEDADVSDVVAQSLERRGVIIHRQAKLECITAIDPDQEGNEVEYRLSYPDGRAETVRVHKALLSVGRIANTDRLDLAAAGVRTDPRTGIIEVQGTRTSVHHIHAVGDATGTNMLVNLGEMEGRHAAECIAGCAPVHLTYDNISTIMFLEPEVAGVGLNEQECRKRGLAYRMARVDYSCLARAIAMRRTKGFFKVIVTDDAEMRILGMRAVGEHASSAIEAVSLMIKLGIPVHELANLIHPHPSITEGVQECARLLLGQSLFKPEVFADKLRCYAWSPEQERVAAA